jgi:hypothetical protein
VPAISSSRYYGSVMPSEFDIFKWLGNDSRGVPYHLHLLNLMWSDTGLAHDLKVYRSVAERLRAEPQYWASCLRGRLGWRSTLVGCACLMLSGERGFVAELKTAFQNGSLVQPQIAVTLGLLHPEEARAFFQSFLEDPESRRDGFGAASARCVLERLGVPPPSPPPSDLEATDQPILHQDRSKLANSVVSEHWEFWSAFVE